MHETPVLEAQNICKQFPGVLANDDVTVHLNKGEILAILGENGAGKTTLLNIIYGLYSQDSGEVFINGKQSLIQNPHDAIRHGIGMVHQHFMLVPVFSVLENIILGSEVTWGPLLDRRNARREILELSDAYGLEVDPDSIIEDIPVGVQQRVEILKALFRHANILILDEPTAVLTPQEIQDLFRIMRQLKERGVSIVFITHKLKEVLEIADRIIVMRGGKVVGETIPSQTDQNKLANMMVGREVLLRVIKEPAQPKEIVFEIKGLTVKDDTNMEIVHNVSLQVRSGEILGIAGLVGSGRTETMRAIFGADLKESGSVFLNGKKLDIKSPRDAVKNGICLLTEDRKEQGLVLEMNCVENTTITNLKNVGYNKQVIQKLQFQQTTILKHKNTQ